MEFGTKKNQTLNVKLLTSNLLESLVLLHSLGICHHDITPNNI
jgi:serine/threonine protein kinase